jgi:hypothetical protein
MNKNIFLMPLIACVYLGCSTAESKNSESIDSTISVRSETVKVDSAMLAQQDIAYGNIKFGTPKKDFEKLKSPEARYSQTIGNSDYHFDYLFDQNKELYFLQIKSLPQDATYLDTDIKKATENLISVLEAKYGPGETLQSYPSILNLNSGYIKFMRIWEIGNKTIKVGVGAEQSSAEFYSTCWIYDNKRDSAVTAYESKQGKDKQKADAVKF